MRQQVFVEDLGSVDSQGRMSRKPDAAPGVLTRDSNVGRGLAQRDFFGCCSPWISD